MGVAFAVSYLDQTCPVCRRFDKKLLKHFYPTNGRELEDSLFDFWSFYFEKDVCNDCMKLFTSHKMFHL